jgi:hypothetical protein
MELLIEGGADPDIQNSRCVVRCCCCPITYSFSSRVAVFYVSLAEGTVKRGDMACDTAPDDESR